MAATYSALSSVIRNDHELMVTAETYILERVPGLSEEALREIKLEAARNQLNVPMMSGLEAVESEAARWHVVSSGCPGIDQLLQYRGFATGTITEFAGMSATGKTQLAFFSILTSLCLVPQSTALFVDSNCSFSIERIRTLFEKSDRFHAAREQGMTAEHILSRLKVSHCYDAHQLLDLLTSLQWSLYNQTGEFERQLKFLIIDSVGSLLAPVVGLPGQQAFLSSVGVVLDAISSYGIPVVVLNHAVLTRDKEKQIPHKSGAMKPALGIGWAQVPTQTLFFTDPSVQVGGGVGRRDGNVWEFENRKGEVVKMCRKRVEVLKEVVAGEAGVGLGTWRYLYIGEGDIVSFPE